MNFSLSLLFESWFGRTENEAENDYRRNRGSSIFGEITVSCLHFKILSICLKIDVLSLLRGVKLPLGIVLCEESPYNLINILGPSSII